MDEKHGGSWPEQARAGKYRATGLAGMDGAPEYAVHGLLPATGATVVFGPGGVGKTQLLLWMAAHVAAPAEAGLDSWLGGAINRRGHVLVLSAEDLREHLLARLSLILRSMGAEREHPGLEVDAVAERIHVLSFLSFNDDEFTGVSPALFRRKGGTWKPSRTLKQIEAFIDDWNGGSSADDRIVGVIMDSAVSLSGFDLANTEATTNFLFRLNRTARQQDVFWAIIGHTPKSTNVDDDNPNSGAVGRLRGSAMWSTTPRTVIEIRNPTKSEKIEVVERAHPGVERRNVLILAVVKSNLKDAEYRPRVLYRSPEGAFTQVEDDPLSQNGALKAEQRSALIELIRGITNGGAPGATFGRKDLADQLVARRDTSPALGSISPEHEGKDAWKGGLAGWLKTFADEQIISSGRRGPCRILALPVQDV